ncbi:Hypothetical predicted protein, partial [Paramuricea clavata]
MDKFLLKDGSSVTGIAKAKVETGIKICGATSGVVDDGVIEWIDWECKVDGEIKENQIKFTPGLQHGDSGSLLVDSSNNMAVGLVFAGSTKGDASFANHIDDVLDALE